MHFYLVLNATIQQIKEIKSKHNTTRYKNHHQQLEESKQLKESKQNQEFNHSTIDNISQYSSDIQLSSLYNTIVEKHTEHDLSLHIAAR